MTRYTLPRLPYAYDALEPHLRGEVVHVHHDHHHRSHVNGANEALERLIEARRRGDPTHLCALERQLALNLSGHVLHSIFWQNLSPGGGGPPEGAIALAIQRDFGGFDLFERQLRLAAATLTGSGWAALVWDPITRRLATTQIYDPPSGGTRAGVPLLVIDLWEHAYHVQYATQRDDYFAALSRLWSWEDVEDRLFRAAELAPGLDDVASFALEAQIASPLARPSE